MTFPRGPKNRARSGAAGFTLVELILAIALLVLLASASVMAFGPWQRQAALPDGTQRFATLLRACQAAAAGTGCRMRVVFAPAESQGAAPVNVEWEPQPLSEPGSFQPFLGSLAGSSDLTDMIRVEACKLTGPSAASATGEVGALAPVTFYPDGSSDWAKVFLASRHASDPRRSVVVLNGTTGTIRTAMYADDTYEE